MLQGKVLIGSLQAPSPFWQLRFTSRDVLGALLGLFMGIVSAWGSVLTALPAEIEGEELVQFCHPAGFFSDFFRQRRPTRLLLTEAFLATGLGRHVGQWGPVSYPWPLDEGQVAITADFTSLYQLVKLLVNSFVGASKTLPWQGWTLAPYDRNKHLVSKQELLPQTKSTLTKLIGHCSWEEHLTNKWQNYILLRAESNDPCLP